MKAFPDIDAMDERKLHARLQLLWCGMKLARELGFGPVKLLKALIEFDRMKGKEPTT